MSTQTINDLRDTIRKLKPAGQDGFEGLMAKVLTELTKRTFALASSGSQRGKDGQSALDNGAITFEGKLYDDAVAKDQVLSKIAEIAVDEEGQTELWIIASTGPISTQHSNTAKRAGRQLGVAVKVLAWPPTGLSELATLIAMAPAASAEFLSQHTRTPKADVVAQLEAVRSDPQFSARSAELQTDLQQPSLAPAYALKDNIAWLSNAFGNKKRARAVFGQALSPEDGSIPGVLDRPALRDTLATGVFSTPDGSITAILGGDGNGKSWIFAQAWTHQTIKPLTILILPDDFKVPFSIESLQELLIAKLLTQAGETATAESTRRWQDHFKRWRHRKDTESPRLVVFVDGLNQRESLDWARLIDALSELVAELGGKLVISSRRVFYRDNLQGRLIAKVVECDVPEWSDSELETLLTPLGTSIQKLHPNVVRSLRNPRLFGVAAELLKGHAIDQFEELSVNRLLFEHIRTGAITNGSSVSPKQFVSDIRTHADQIVERLKVNQEADLTVFNRPSPFASSSSGRTVTDQFVLTSAGRFFEILDDDPSKYVLKDEGLSLALGLSLVNTARTALRQNTNVDDALSKILDPIVALDRTSDVLIGAILAAVLDQSPAPVIAALVRSFIALQNLDQSLYPEFQALLRQNPIAFIAGLEEAALTENVTSNLSWLIQAVHDTRGSPECSTALKSAIHRWLSMYSTAPERMTTLPPDGQEEERKKRRAKREGEIADALAQFTDVEHALLATLVKEERGNYSSLSDLAFQFLAGHPLAEYAESLRNWAFAASFNGGFRNHHADFDHLIGLNLADWKASRLAILEAAKVFRAPGMSKTGSWALAYLLRATADSTDAAEAQQIVNELTKDRERREGWRLVETFCDTDPCDPSSQRPANIDATAEKYRALDVSTLKEHTGRGGNDHLFDMARPGLARFRPDAALETMRRFAEHSLSRETAGFRTAAFFIEPHTIALEDSAAPGFVTKAAEIATEALAGDENNEKYGAAQYSLLIAFPHMSGDAQFDALIAHPKDSTFLLALGHLFQPCDPARLETALEQAGADTNEVAQFRILAFAELSRTPLTQRIKDLAIGLLASSHKHVRLSALGLFRTTADPDLLAALVNSNWRASNLDSVSDNVEIMHGSEALVLASEKGLLSIESCLERIDLLAYQDFVIRLGPSAASAVAARLDIAIRKAAEFKVQTNLPNIEQRFEGQHWPSVLDISEKPVDQGMAAQLDQPSDADAWYQRQQRNQDAAERFERELSKAGAQIIIKSVTAKLIAEIDRVDPAMTDSWLNFFSALDQAALNNVHNVASALAEAISHRNSAGSLALIRRLASGSPHVRATFGRDHLSLDAVTAWAAAPNAEMTALRAQRLDRTASDHELAVEVLAAIWANREDELRDYVLDRRSREEPAYRARAAMVAGFSPKEDWALETIALLKDSHGFLKRAYEGATYAMDRHLWSKHWSRLMATATDPIDVWRYSILLYKIVDGRFRTSDLVDAQPSTIIERFGPTFSSTIRNRINHWKNERSSKLFGMQAPDKIFLPS
ncbi:hypothetical protein ACVMIH_003760 [Bradyrhizobium sp. USDA 4503]